MQVTPRTWRRASNVGAVVAIVGVLILLGAYSNNPADATGTTVGHIMGRHPLDSIAGVITTVLVLAGCILRVAPIAVLVDANTWYSTGHDMGDAQNFARARRWRDLGFGELSEFPTTASERQSIARPRDGELLSTVDRLMLPWVRSATTAFCRRDCLRNQLEAFESSSEMFNAHDGDLFHAGMDLKEMVEARRKFQQRKKIIAKEQKDRFSMINDVEKHLMNAAETAKKRNRELKDRFEFLKKMVWHKRWDKTMVHSLISKKPEINEDPESGIVGVRPPRWHDIAGNSGYWSNEEWENANIYRRYLVTLCGMQGETTQRTVVCALQATADDQLFSHVLEKETKLCVEKIQST